jgi:endonuclease/exonuclease/phosphatase family metal-dependent hydrolase
VTQTKKPYVVAGDFNMLWGEREIDLFLAATGLQNANTSNLPTFPSNNPNRHLDFILFSKGIVLRDFRVPRVTFSDHLPLVFDFDIEVERERRRKSRWFRPSPRASIPVG